MIDDAVFVGLLSQVLAHGGEYADIFVEHRASTAIQLEDDKIEKVLTGINAGVGVRLIYNGKTAYGFTNDFSEAALKELADTVSRAFPGNAGMETDLVFDMKRLRPSVVFPVKRPASAIPVSDKVALVRRGNDAARKFDSRIRQVSVTYRDTLQKVKIFTSEGSIAEEERAYTMGLVQVVAMEGETIQTGYEPVGGLTGYELFDENPMELVGREAAERAVLMLRAGRAPGGRMPVVISSEAGGTMIHEAIGHGLEADLAQQGLSVYSGKKGEKVASSVITVLDDATIPYKRGSFSFDDEGTPSQRNVLVKDGILVGYMYDRLTAMNDGVVSTGNGRRESYDSRPIPRMTNTFIAPGSTDPAEVVRSVDKGLLVRRMGGGQVNTVTGDFVFEVQEGYLIEKGEVGVPVRGATLIGSGPEVLNSIDLVGSDLGFAIGTCGKDSQGVPVSDAMPTLRIPEIVVGGEVR